MEDLAQVSFDEITRSGKFIVKTTMWDSKDKWQEIPYKRIIDHFDTIDNNALRDGTIGFHLQPYIYYYQTPLYMVALDVESPDQHHQSLQANIATGKNLYYQFDMIDVTRELVIALTGNGFRFHMPCLIPYTYTKAFLAMVRDSKRFHGIDPAPQTGANKFLRTFAYRGNSRQDQTTKNVHVHFLEDSREILSMDENRYNHLVSGYPDKNEYRKALPKILPQGFAPEPLLNILKEYELSLKLKSTIATPTGAKPRRTYQVNWEQIFGFLQDQGIEHHSHQWEGGEIVKIDTCPSCGESEGNPYLTQHGILKCFRTNNCQAGQEYGLRPDQWIEGYQGSAVDNMVSGSDLPSLTLDAAREKNRAAIENAMQNGENVCINTSPGVGKTHESLNQAVPAAQDKLILYTAPTLKLAEEAFETAQAIAENHDLSIHIIKLSGRNDNNCKDISQVTDVAEKGYSPAYIVCSECDFKKECAYLDQFDHIPTNGLICTSHDMAVCHQNKFNPNLWIVDENPVNNFITTAEVPQAEMNKMREVETDDVKPLFDEIKRTALRIAADLSPHEQARSYLTEVPPGRWEDSPMLQALSPILSEYFTHGLLPSSLSLHSRQDNENLFRWENAAYKTDVDLRAIKFWDLAVQNENNILLYVRITEGSNNTLISYVTTHFNAPKFINCQIIHLDGTMFKPEIDEVFPENDQIVDAQVRLDGVKKVFIKSARGKTKMKNIDYEKKEKDLKYLFRFLDENNQKVLLITHKFTEDIVLEIAKKLHPELTLGSQHFWGPRGINDFKDYDACIVYGTPTVNSAGVEDQAMALFDDTEVMSTWKDSLGKRDLAQVIHRIRPVNGGKTIIVMGTYWPTEYLGQPDLQIDLMRKGNNYDEAKDRLTNFATKYGFMDKSIAMLLGVATRNDEEALLQTQQLISNGQGGASELVLTLIDINKSECQFQGTPPAIFLKGSTEWKRLMDDIHAETGLPYMHHKLIGAGRKALALGTPERVEAFCEKAGTHFNKTQYTPCPTG